MYKIIKSIKGLVPKFQSGFSFRKSQVFYIPFLEIGIECLIRNVSAINLFHETILKLIEIEVKDIVEIARILGVTFEIIKEAIVDMVEGDYIGVSENNLRITKKGSEALRTKQLVELKKHNINQVMIDLITGDIQDGNSIKYHKIRKHDICLDKKINITKEYLDSKYSAVNLVFEQRQENDSVFGRISVTKELYKIIGISYQNLIYVKNELFIYENDNTDDIQVQLKNDVNNQYLDCLYEQLKNGTHPCLESFFEKSQDFIRAHSHNKNFDKELTDATNKICSCLRNEDPENINIETFVQKRYMVSDKEYISYFNLSDELTFDKLIIITNRVNSVLLPELFDEMKRIAIKKPVVLIYDDSEFNASKNVNYHLTTEKSNKNMTVKRSTDIKCTKIFFAPFLQIDIEEKILNAFNKTITYKSGILNFDIDFSNGDLKDMMAFYNIDEILQKQPYK